ncbi:hypothetical protein [Methanospirillum hungatei]|nr:hypothetical protein [Methanospirillum hungatei]
MHVLIHPVLLGVLEIPGAAGEVSRRMPEEEDAPPGRQQWCIIERG